MYRLPPPRFEGSVRPAGGRRLVWLHGTPGDRRQTAPQARRLADERGAGREA